MNEHALASEKVKRSDESWEEYYRRTQVRVDDAPSLFFNNRDAATDGGRGSIEAVARRVMPATGKLDTESWDDYYKRQASRRVDADEQPRDPHGQFASSGGGGDKSDAAKKADKAHGKASIHYENAMEAHSMGDHLEVGTHADATSKAAATASKAAKLGESSAAHTSAMHSHELAAEAHTTAAKSLARDTEHGGEDHSAAIAKHTEKAEAEKNIAGHHRAKAANPALNSDERRAATLTRTANAASDHAKTIPFTPGHPNATLAAAHSAAAQAHSVAADAHEQAGNRQLAKNHRAIVKGHTNATHAFTHGYKV